MNPSFGNTSNSNKKHINRSNSQKGSRKFCNSYCNSNTNSLNSTSILVFVIGGTMSRKISLRYNQCAKISSWLKKSRSCTTNMSWPAAASFFTTCSWPPKTHKRVLSLPPVIRSPTLFGAYGLVVPVSLYLFFLSYHMALRTWYRAWHAVDTKPIGKIHMHTRLIKNGLMRVATDQDSAVSKSLLDYHISLPGQSSDSSVR